MFLAVKMEKMVGRHRDWQLFFFLQKQFCKKTLKLVREFNLVQTGADRQCLCSRPLAATAYGGHTLAA
jgi:hypothetical protein